MGRGRKEKESERLFFFSGLPDSTVDTTAPMVVRKSFQDYTKSAINAPYSPQGKNRVVTCVYPPRARENATRFIFFRNISPREGWRAGEGVLQISEGVTSSMTGDGERG